MRACINKIKSTAPNARQDDEIDGEKLERKKKIHLFGEKGKKAGGDVFEVFFLFF